MSDPGNIENDFLRKLTSIIHENISNDQFGVSELASMAGMSRSNLLRKIKKLTGLSASRYISRVRLEEAMEMLKDQSYTVSEVSYKVGFGSTSYFIKCFKDQYGYPPGEAITKVNEEIAEDHQEPSPSKGIRPLTWSLILLTIVVLLIVYFDPFGARPQKMDKSIAVLPFINDSRDSSNIHIVNGLMESTLNKLQKIEDLRVISRTSVEKYRDNQKTIPEIAKELDVTYFVEGSGQKIGNDIMLNIQLIEGATDKHLWAGQYKREAVEIFKLQNEIAQDIAKQVNAVITPQEKALIEKAPTDNLEAYELFLKGLDLLTQGPDSNIHKAIVYFERAIEIDSSFSNAYADIAIGYYFLDIFNQEKQYTSSINHYADQALLYDPQLAEALMAKAMFYINSHEYALSVPYLEKALEYNPNSAYVIGMLADHYATKMPDTKEYLKYALKGVRLDISSYDSSITSFVYLHIGNALIQSGFSEEAEIYINRSLEYNPSNIYSQYVRAYILYAQSSDLKLLTERLLKVFEQDTTRLDVMQEIAKSYFYQRDYEKAYRYYKKFTDIREQANLSLFTHENAKIGLVFSKMGFKDEADEYFAKYKAYVDADASIYKNLSLAVYYAYYNETELALESLRLFSQQDNFQYWTLLLEIDPLVDNIKDHPEFKKIMDEIKDKFWLYHKQIRVSLKEEGLI